MSSTETTPFNYSYIPGVSQYSAGVKAATGHEIVRVRLASTPPIADAFNLIENYLSERALSPEAVCAFEMRSPGQFTEESFKRFNETYLGRLANWGVLNDGVNPVARANVIPDSSGLTEPSVHAFSFVQSNPDAADSFVISGSGEAPEGRRNYRDHIVALGDTSSEGMAQKAKWVIGEMTRRLDGLGFTWTDVTDVQVYTTHPYNDAHAELAASIPTAANIAWHYCKPPVEGLEFEMDCRRVHVEHMLRG